MEDKFARCDACGVCRAVPMFRAIDRNNSSNDKNGPIVRFCYACGSSFPSEVLVDDVALNKQGAEDMHMEQFSLKEAEKLLQKRLASKKKNTFICCASCSLPSCMSIKPQAPESFFSSLSPSLPLTSSDDIAAPLLSTSHKSHNGEENGKRPPDLHAWTLDFGAAEKLNATNNSSMIFARFGDVCEVFLELLLEHNTRVATLQTSCLQNTGVLRRQIFELKREIQRHVESKIFYEKRLESLENELRLQKVKHAEEIMKERQKIKEERRWRVGLDEGQKEQMKAAFNVLRDTLVLKEDYK